MADENKTSMPNADMPASPPNAGWRDDVSAARGLSKREHIAAMALQGLLAHAYHNPEAHARHAVYAADALLAELEKTQ